MLKQSLEFRSLFMNSTDAIVMLDKNNCVININEEFTKLFGYELKDIKEIDIDKLITNEDTITSAEKLTNMVSKGEEVDFEEIRYDKDGNGKEVTIKGIPIVINGETVGIYAIYSDISLRKSVERELLKQNSNFKALFTNAKEAIVMIDEFFCIVDINSEFTQLFGYELGDIIGKNVDDIISNVGDRDRAREMSINLFEGRVVNSEDVRCGLGGIEREVSIRDVPIITDGEVVGGYGIYSDISQRKNKERDYIYKLS
ncbi:MAG: PAS domain-containing protein [Bacillota bacterium]|nr:PAS domain-containing protein [Bacillota bacterium]